MKSCSKSPLCHHLLHNNLFSLFQSDTLTSVSPLFLCICRLTAGKVRTEKAEIYSRSPESCRLGEKQTIEFHDITGYQRCLNYHCRNVNATRSLCRRICRQGRQIHPKSRQDRLMEQNSQEAEGEDGKDEDKEEERERERKRGSISVSRT